MAVREHTDIYNKNYYWSSFNPHKIFQTLAAAENYEKLYYVEHFKNIHFYLSEEDLENNNEIVFSYDPVIEWQYYANLGKIEERMTVEPTFTYTKDGVTIEKSLYYFYNLAKYLKIDIYTDEQIPQTKKIRKMNKIISTLNKYWKMDLPTTIGKYKYSKINGWERIT